MTDDTKRGKAPWLRRSCVLTAILLAIILVAPLVVPIPPLANTVAPEELADPDSRFVEVDGLSLHYKSTGTGKPSLVLLHGFGASLFSWREVMGPLGRLGTVVAFDRPAFGLTERALSWEKGENPYTPDAQVDLLFGLMDELAIDRAILVGNSAGGTVALHAAVANPERVQGLVLVDAAIYEGGGAPSWSRPLLRVPQVDRLGPLLARQIAVRGDQFLERAWHDPSKLTVDIVAGYREPLRVNDWDLALWELTKASRASDLAGSLEEPKIPALVISGDDDRIVPPESSVRLARELPDAELVIIPNCGHLPQEECPSEFLEAMEGYLPRAIGDHAAIVARAGVQ